MKVISKRYIIELTHNGIEYHVTVSDDLKTIYDIDILTFPFETRKRLHQTALLELIWEAFSNNKLELN